MWTSKEKSPPSPVFLLSSISAALFPGTVFRPAPYSLILKGEERTVIGHKHLHAPGS